jgi:predicted RNA-binding protein with PUA-like domain
MAAWIIVGRPTHWDDGVATRAWKLPLKMMNTWKSIAEGDTALFYVTNPVKGLIGLGTVASIERSVTPLFDEEIEAGEVLWQLQINFQNMRAFDWTEWETRRVSIPLGLVSQRSLHRLKEDMAAPIVKAVQAALSAVGH